MSTRASFSPTRSCSTVSRPSRNRLRRSPSGIRGISSIDNESSGSVGCSVLLRLLRDAPLVSVGLFVAGIAATGDGLRGCCSGGGGCRAVVVLAAWECRWDPGLGSTTRGAKDAEYSERLGYKQTLNGEEASCCYPLTFGGARSGRAGLSFRVAALNVNSTGRVRPPSMSCFCTCLAGRVVAISLLARRRSTTADDPSVSWPLPGLWADLSGSSRKCTL
jgi:hypothetical protein